MSLPQPPAPAPPSEVPACYRHPDREGGRRCTRCGKPACSECLVQAAVGSHCVDCAKASKPSAVVRARDWNARQLIPVTYALMAANIALFVYIGIREGGVGDRVNQTQFDLGLNKLWLQLDDKWYRLVTSGFIHFGVIHIAMNMFLLYQLGMMLERALGRVQFALLYLAGLLGGSAGVILLSGDSLGITGGASGAVFGLMAAAAIGMHRRGINVFRTGIGTTLLLNLVLTFTIPNISVGGHLGGALAGAICGYVMLAPRQRNAPRWPMYAAPLLVSAVALVLAVLVTNAATLPPTLR